MFGARFNLFRIAGIQIRIDLSWFIIVLLIAWSLATALFPFRYPDHSTTTYWTMGFAAAIGLFVSILLHELGHALTARRFGVEMSGITLFIFGGVAEMREEPRNASAEFLIAIAGPIVSVILGGACMGLAAILPTEALVPARGVISYLGIINLVLVLFNMLPAFPLDGGRVFRAALWHWKGDLRWATRVAATVGSAFGFALIALAIVSFIAGNFIGGVWWVVIGLFLRNAAQMSYQQVLVRRALEGEPVRRFMVRDVITVPPNLPINEFVDDYVYQTYHKLYPVVDSTGELRGCVMTADLRAIHRSDWATRSIADVMKPCSPENTISPDADATEALSRMSREKLSRLVVIEDNHLVGIITLKDLLRFLSLKVEFEDEATQSGNSIFGPRRAPLAGEPT